MHLWGFQPVNYATPLPTPTGAAASTNNTSQRYILYRAAIANGTTAGTRFRGFQFYGRLWCGQFQRPEFSVRITELRTTSLFY